MWDWCQGVKEFYSPVMADATSDICSCELISYSCDIIITLWSNYLLFKVRFFPCPRDFLRFECLLGLFACRPGRLFLGFFL